MLYVRTKLRKREAKLSRGIMFHTVSICQHLSASVSICQQTNTIDESTKCGFSGLSE